MPDEPCVHIAAITTVRHAKRRECEECVKIGARWVHLRTCQECGTTQCCDDSPNRHASKHARATGHPVIASAEPGERWLYCYPDEAFAEYRADARLTSSCLNAQRPAHFRAAHSGVVHLRAGLEFFSP